VSEVEPAGGSGFLAQYGATSSEVALALPADLSFDDYTSIVRLLGRISRASAWWIGDTLIHGEAAYGELYAQAMNDFGLAYQTLANYGSVCRQVPPARRRPELSFGHHAAVAMLEPKQQDKWLAEAIKKDWSRNQLREAIAATTEKGKGKVDDTVDPDQTVPPVPAQPGDPPLQEGAQEVLPLADGFPDSLAHLQEVEQAAHGVWDTLLPLAALDPAQREGYYAVPNDMVRQLANALGEEMIEDVTGDEEAPAPVAAADTTAHPVDAEPEVEPPAAPPAPVQPLPPTAPPPPVADAPLLLTEDQVRTGNGAQGRPPGAVGPGPAPAVAPAAQEPPDTFGGEVPPEQQALPDGWVPPDDAAAGEHRTPEHAAIQPPAEPAPEPVAAQTDLGETFDLD
jgi:hypothetical protein